MGIAAAFIRVINSNGGVWDIPMGAQGQILVSNGETVAPSFQDPPAGQGVPRGFSYTQQWEKEILERNSFKNFGIANFTQEWERTSAQGTNPHGPACYTTQSDSPWSRRV